MPIWNHTTYFKLEQHQSLGRTIRPWPKQATNRKQHWKTSWAPGPTAPHSKDPQGKEIGKVEVLHILHSDVYAQKRRYATWREQARGARLYLPLQISFPRGQGGMAGIPSLRGKLIELTMMEQFWQTLQAPAAHHTWGQTPNAKAQRKESTKSLSSHFQTAASQLVSLPGLRAARVFVQNFSPWHQSAGGEG